MTSSGMEVRSPACTLVMLKEIQAIHSGMMTQVTLSSKDDYIIKGGYLFETKYIYARFEEDRC